MNPLVIKAFADLAKEALEIEKSKRVFVSKTPMGGGSYVDTDLFTEWGLRVINLLERTFGDGNLYVKQFEKEYNQINKDRYEEFVTLRAFFQAAHKDYTAGYNFSLRSLIQAEVFDDFLEQAQHLFDNGYFQVSAVVAGCVLEDCLRQMCGKHSITLPDKAKLDFMNSELTKAGAYNLLTQKQVTALADLRNKAAHGKWEEFKKEDVSNMLQEVRRFVTTYS